MGEFVIEIIFLGRYCDDEDEWVFVYIYFILEKEGYWIYVSEFFFDIDIVLLNRGNIDVILIVKCVKDFEYEVVIWM